jgi:DNA-binding CsgD family transcriptional regulator
LHSSAAGPETLVGRQRQLAAWNALLDEADIRLPAVIDIVGDPGVGKTALLKVFADRARARGLQVLTEPRNRSTNKPEILLLDDVDRANGVASDQVAELFDRRLCDNFVVVVAHRPRQTSPRLKYALTAAKAIQVELSGLREQDLDSLGADNLCDSHRHRELRESGGNPEYVRTLAAWCTGPGSCVGGPLPAPHLPIPGAAAATWSELVGLPDASKAVVRAASVAGTEFDPELLSEVARMPQDAVLAGIDDLLAADLIRPAGSIGQLGFRNLMTRWIAYASTPGGSRFGAHLRALNVMRARGEAADTYAVHVERCARVGDLDSVHSLIEAARLTASLSPWTAVYWYTASLRLLPAGSAHHELRSEVASELAECGADAGASTVTSPGKTAALLAVGRPRTRRLPSVPTTDPMGCADMGSILSQLSSRESEVAVLVSRGRTNQQIARTLGVSHKTIETYLSRVFAKLNISSRAEIANLVGRTEGADSAMGHVRWGPCVGDVPDSLSAT